MSVPRAAFEAFITENGGSVAKSVTNSVTHLVSAETGTKKCQDAEAKGVAIVDEDWVRNKVAGKGSAPTPAPAPPTKKAAAAPAVAAKPTPAPAPAAPAASSSAATGVFAGVNFNVAGSQEFKAPMEELISSNGGSLVAINASCHFLVCPEEAMDKLSAVARMKGIELVNDQWVIDHVVEGETVHPPGGSTSAAAPAPVAVAKVKAAPAPPPAPAPAAKATKAKAAPAPAAAKKAAPAAAGGKPLAGMTICITGTLSEPRAAFEAMLTKNGASVAKSVTNSVTHLVSAETGTKKCQDAEAKGVKIVDEDWIRAKISGGGDDDDDDDDGEDEDDEDDEEGEEEDGEDGPSSALEGCCFAITGKRLVV